MKTRGASFFLIFILLLIIYAVTASLTFRYPEDKMLILLVGGIILILGIVQLTKEFRVRNRAQKPIEEKTHQAAVSSAENQRVGLVLAWMGGLFLSIYLLGFFIACPLFVLTYLKRHEVSWLKATSIVVILTVTIYGLFEYALKVELYRGLVFLWL